VVGSLPAHRAARTGRAGPTVTAGRPMAAVAA